MHLFTKLRQMFMPKRYAEKPVSLQAIPSKHDIVAKKHANTRPTEISFGQRNLPRPVRGFKFTRYDENPNQRRVIVVEGS